MATNKKASAEALAYLIGDYTILLENGGREGTIDCRVYCQHSGTFHILFEGDLVHDGRDHKGQATVHPKTKGISRTHSEWLITAHACWANIVTYVTLFSEEPIISVGFCMSPCRSDYITNHLGCSACSR